MGPFRGILLARIWEMRSREEPFLATNHSQSLNVFQYNIDIDTRIPPHLTSSANQERPILISSPISPLILQVAFGLSPSRNQLLRRCHYEYNRKVK